MVKSGNMRCGGMTHVWWDEKQEMHINFCLEKNEGEGLTALGLDGRITLKWIFMK
jgi:hypothetical protein